MKNKKSFLLLVVVFSFFSSFSQDDLLSLVDATEKPPTHEKVAYTFKATKIINAQSTETVKAKTMDFRITHRFGNIGAASGGGVHSLYGWDNIADMRMSFDFGITNKLTVGIARSKRFENIDGTIKYRFLDQTKDDVIPFSVAFFQNAALSVQTNAQFYSGTTNVTQKFAHKISYISQLIIARKCDDLFSFELLPTYQHRNFVKAYLNDNNKAVNPNDIFSLGLGGRLKLTKRFAIVADYFITYSDYFLSNPSTPFYNPFAIGCEIETGGHVFHLNFTNASAIIENEFISNTTDDWYKGGYKFGFNISRVFNL